MILRQAQDERGKPELIRRRDAMLALTGKYDGKAWAWARGRTCAHAARFHLRSMGHRPPSLPQIRSLIGAKRALQVRGWADVGEMLDALLPRIAPAALWLGDLVMVPSDDGLGSINFYAGGRKFVGWHGAVEGFALIDLDLSDVSGAWRV